MVDAGPTLCSRCRRQPPLAPAPFCAACLLTQGSAADCVHHQHPAPGTTVGSYEIVELLGEGGFAEVYSARPARPDPAAGKPASIPGRPPAVVAVDCGSSLSYLPADGGSPVVLPMPFRVNGYYPAPMAFHPASGLLADAVDDGFAVYDLRSLPATPLLRRRCACALVTALGFSWHTR